QIPIPTKLRSLMPRPRGSFGRSTKHLKNCPHRGVVLAGRLVLRTNRSPSSRRLVRRVCLDLLLSKRWVLMVKEEQDADKFAQEVEAGRYEVVCECERLELAQEVEAGRADKVRARLELEQAAGRRAVFKSAS